MGRNGVRRLKERTTGRGAEPKPGWGHETEPKPGWGYGTAVRERNQNPDGVTERRTGAEPKPGWGRRDEWRATNLLI